MTGGVRRGRFPPTCPRHCPFCPGSPRWPPGRCPTLADAWRDDREAEGDRLLSGYTTICGVLPTQSGWSRRFASFEKLSSYRRASQWITEPGGLAEFSGLSEGRRFSLGAADLNDRGRGVGGGYRASPASSIDSLIARTTATP